MATDGDGEAAHTWLFLVRHGQTFWNVDKRLQGHSNSNLTRLGRGQAVCAANFLRSYEPSTKPGSPPTGLPFSAIYASDLYRAADTAAPIAEALSLPVTLDQRLRETKLGLVSGHTWVEAQRVYPKEVTKYHANPESPLPAGESHADQIRRTGEAMLEIAAAHRGQNVILVSHGGTINAASEFAFGSGHPERVHNASVSIFRFTHGIDAGVTSAGAGDGATSASASDTASAIKGDWQLVEWDISAHCGEAVETPRELPCPLPEIEEKIGSLWGNEELMDAMRHKFRSGCQHEASPILDGFLYLSGADWLKENISDLPSLGITHVLNMAGSEIGSSTTADGSVVPYPREKFPDMGIELLEEECDDSDTWCAANDVVAMFARTSAFIATAKEKGGAVLVHCSAGQSRSASAVIAYLMELLEWRLVRAFLYVRGRRKYAFPGCGFFAALIDLEFKMFGEPRSMTHEVVPHLHESGRTSIWRASQQLSQLVEALGGSMGDESLVERARAALTASDGDASAAMVALLS